MIHTPVHASWLNQIEIVFSVIQRKVLTPGDFPGLGTLSYTLLAFVTGVCGGGRRRRGQGGQRRR